MTAKRWADLALWLPAAYLMWVFLQQGSAKFSDTSGWAKAFAVWHFPVWFRVLIGCMEIAGALLLVTRRTAPLGAALIAVVMLGAMGTHISRGHPEQVTSEVVPLTMALIVGIGRLRHLRTWWGGT